MLENKLNGLEIDFWIRSVNVLLFLPLILQNLKGNSNYIIFCLFLQFLSFQDGTKMFISLPLSYWNLSLLGFHPHRTLCPWFQTSFVVMKRKWKFSIAVFVTNPWRDRYNMMHTWRVAPIRYNASSKLHFLASQLHVDHLF